MSIELGERRAKELGLKICRCSYDGPKWLFHYDGYSIHKLLGEASEVMSQWECLGNGSNGRSAIWHTSYTQLKNPTDIALLIGIKPIEKDSAEKCLKDIINWISKSEIISFRGDNVPGLDMLWKLEERAKKLLDKK